VKIERVEVRGIRLALKRPFETSFARTTTREFLLIAVSEGGETGYAECVADRLPDYLPETNQTALHVLKDILIPSVLQGEIKHPEELRFPHVRGHQMAKASVEMAAWELLARQQGVPLSRLLGGTRSTIPSGVSIGLQESVAALVRTVENELHSGYQRIKIKIKPGRDMDLVAGLRERFPDLPLMVDANSSYTLADTPLFQELDRYGLMMVEQPLAWDDMVDHATLQKAIQTPVCLDESIHSAEDVRRAHSIGACRIINLKVGRIGGFAEARTLEALCRAKGIPLWCGGMLESGIGRLANVHLQTLPGFTLPGDTSASERYFEEDLVDPPVVVSKEGTIRVPDGPGIGHSIVFSRVERATVFREVFTRAPQA
jgi:O-succinylbenzoate synthase